jgi:transposase
VILFALLGWVVDAGEVVTQEQAAELRAVINSRDVPAVVGTRARIVLWMAEGKRRKDVAELAGVSLPTVDRWVDRYATAGLAGLEERKRGAGREQVPASVRARILALTRATPPMETGLSHWSSREMAAYLQRTAGVSVSWHYIAKLWRDNDLKPHRQGTFKLSKDPRFADKVADIVGLYLQPPGGAVVLSIDEKTQIQALDRTQPLLPLDFGVTEQRTHDYRRHGVTNLVAALDVASGQVTADCHPVRDGAAFLAFLRKAVKPYRGKEIHVVLDNLSTHTTPDVQAWLQANPNVTFHFTPTGSSWLNMIVRHASRMSTATLIEGGSTDVEGVVPGPVRKDRPRLGVRRG